MTDGPRPPGAGIGIVAAAFGLGDALVAVDRLTAGHIHESYLSTVVQGGEPHRYVHQRINTYVFPRPREVMENIHRVTQHLTDAVQRARLPDASRRVLRLVPALDGAPFWIDGTGAWWRTYRYIDGAVTARSVDNPPQARQAARAFGEFTRLLADLPGPRLHETIAHFHDTPQRLRALLGAVESDPHSRAAAVGAEIAFALDRKPLAQVLATAAAGGELPVRVVHNDSKITNVLFDAHSGEALCVIDLDTVMPGIVLNDFGDLVRSSVAATAEDAGERPRVRLEIFEALVGGYLEGLEGLLSPAELDRLAIAGTVITFELGLRFLTDHLQGDVYFRAERPGHNLARCRNQFRLVQELERRQPELKAIVSGQTSGLRLRT